MNLCLYKFSSVSEWRYNRKRQFSCISFEDSHLHLPSALFCDVTPCSVQNWYQRFRGTCCLHPQGNYRKIFFQNSRRHVLEDSNLHSQSGEKIKFHIDDEKECSSKVFCQEWMNQSINQLTNQSILCFIRNVRGFTLFFPVSVSS